MSVRNLSKISIKRNKRKIVFTFMSVRNLSKISIKRNKRKRLFTFMKTSVVNVNSV